VLLFAGARKIDA